MNVHKIPQTPAEVAWYHYVGWGMGLRPYRHLGGMSTKGKAAVPFFKVAAYVLGEVLSEIPRALSMIATGFAGVCYLIILTVGSPLTVLGTALITRRDARREIAERSETS